jgi:hypothetical protein
MQLEGIRRTGLATRRCAPTLCLLGGETTCASGWERLALAVWLAALLVICVRVLVARHSHSVYPIYAAAARNWLAGADLYDPAEGYRYSPTAALLLVPFSALSDALGDVTWRLLTVSVYVAALAWWCWAVLPVRLTRSQRGVLFLLVLPLSIGNLNNGQSNLLVIGLLLAACASAARRRWNLTAGCVVLASLFKVYPIAVGLLLVLVYPRRLVWRLLAGLAVGLALPFLLQDPHCAAQQYLGWLHHLQSNNRQALSLALVYRDVRLLWRVWLVPLDAPAYAMIQLAVGAGIAALILALRVRARLPRRRAWEATPAERRLLVSLLGLGCCWMTLFGPATESCTYGLLAPTLAWAVLEARLLRNAGWLGSVAIGSYALFVCAELLVWFPDGRWLRNLGTLPLAASLLFVALMIQAFRRLGRPGLSAPPTYGPFVGEVRLEEPASLAA